MKRGLQSFEFIRVCGLATISCGVTVALSVGPAVQAQQPVQILPATLAAQPERLPTPAAPAPPAPADRSPPPLTLPDLEQIALANNPSLARAQALVAAARGNWWQVGLPANPAIGYLGQQIGSGGQAEQHALLIDHEFITGGKLGLNREIAMHDVMRAEQQLAAQQQRVLTDVRLAFFEALLAQRRLELAEELLRIAKLGQSTAERLHRAGETSRIDVLQSNLEAEAAEIEVNKAANQHAKVWRMLAAVVGVPQMPPAALRGDLEAAAADLPWEEALGRLLSASPEVAAAVANIDRARAALVRARAEPIPNVRFQGGVMQDNGIGGKTDGIVQVLLPLPLINKNDGAIRQAESELVAAEHALAQLELDLQSRLAAVYERYASAANQVRRYRERILPTAQESLDQVRALYSAGEIPYLNLLNAQRTFFQANLQYLDVLRELRLSSTEIDGLLLRDSLSFRP